MIQLNLRCLTISIHSKAIVYFDTSLNEINFIHTTFNKKFHKYFVIDRLVMEPGDDNLVVEINSRLLKFYSLVNTNKCFLYVKVFSRNR